MANHRPRAMRGVYVLRRGKSWAFRLELPPDPLTRRRRRIYRGGFEDEDSAWQAALAAKSEIRDDAVEPTRLTVRQFFREWLESIEHEVKPSTFAKLQRLPRCIRPAVTRRSQAPGPQRPSAQRAVPAATDDGRRKPDNNSTMYEYWRARADTGTEPTPREVAGACGTTIHAARKAVARYRRGRVPLGRAGGLAPKTAKNVHFMLHLALKDAVAWQYLNTNPATSATLPRSRRGPGSRPAPWTADELARWLQLALNDRFAALWMLAATTGMRRSELAGLRRADLLLNERLIVTGEDTRVVVAGRAQDSDGKTPASARTISIDETTTTLLRRHLAMLDDEQAAFDAEYAGDGRLLCFPNGKAPHPGHHHKHVQPARRSSRRAPYPAARRPAHLRDTVTRCRHRPEDRQRPPGSCQCVRHRPGLRTPVGGVRQTCRGHGRAHDSRWTPTGRRLSYGHCYGH